MAEAITTPATTGKGPGQLRITMARKEMGRIGKESEEKE